jgi:catechol 2,3-dioxygenase-like lactoylglutathione lyase family enzyme
MLNHTIVLARDKEATARHLTTLLGLPEPTSYGPFAVVQLANGVSLDVADDHGEPQPQHYAFLVTEEEFDAVLGRLVEQGRTYWADPFHRRPGAVNRADGGRGLYWLDPNGHSLEVLTVPYGGWPS